MFADRDIFARKVLFFSRSSKLPELQVQLQYVHKIATKTTAVLLSLRPMALGIHSVWVDTAHSRQTTR